MPDPTDHDQAPTIPSPSEGDLTGPWAAPAPAPARPAGLPEQVGRYRLGGELARGGMGAVVEALDPDLGRRVAVKVLLERHQGNADLVARFLEEAQVSGQLQHPGLVPVY